MIWITLTKTPENHHCVDDVILTGRFGPGWRVRPLAMSDVDDVLDAFASSDDMARQGDVTDLASARDYVRQHVDDPDRISLVAISPDGHAQALAVAVISPQNRSAWVYYWAHVLARGQGVTSSLVRFLSDWVIDNRQVERLELGYRLNNPASAAVARKAGFIVEGIERGKFLIEGNRYDAAVAGRLATDPRP